MGLRINALVVSAAFLFICCPLASAQLPHSPFHNPGVKYKPIQSNMVLMGTLNAGLGEVEEIETRTVDLAQTVSKFAELKKLSIEDARVETLTFLGLHPRLRRTVALNDSPTFELVEADRYKITASASYFERLPAMQSCLELGMKQVVVSCQIISIEPKHSKRINAFLKPGTVQVNCSKIPDVAPVATAKDSEKDPFSYITASTTITRNTPVTTGHITRENLEKLSIYVRESSAEISMAPKIIMYPGQVGTISDAAQKPFVVGLEAVFGDNNRTAMQPVVQALEDGVTIRLKAVPRDDKVQLMGDIAISEIQDVDSFTFASAGEDGQQSIQIPQHCLRQIHFSTPLDPDTSIMIDPNFVQTEEITGRRGKPTNVPRKTIFVLRTRMIDLPDDCGMFR